MSKEPNATDDSNLTEKEERILFGGKSTQCFACGANIDKEEQICPYCKTKQE